MVSIGRRVFLCILQVYISDWVEGESFTWRGRGHDVGLSVPEAELLLTPLLHDLIHYHGEKKGKGD